MKNFTNGKVYRIRMGEFYYIGSTILTLKNRLHSHKGMSKKHPHLKVYTKAADVGWDNVTIELVELYPCSTLAELLARESSHIVLTDDKCLNARPSHVTEEQRKATHKSVNKEWRDKNKEHRKTYKKEYNIKKKALETDEERQKRRDYQREYMRRRRAESRG